MSQLLGNQTSLIIVIFVVIIFFYMLTRLIRVVPETERLVVLSLGRYAGTRGPGVAIVIPVIEQARKVDIRERFLDLRNTSSVADQEKTVAVASARRKVNRPG